MTFHNFQSKPTDKKRVGRGGKRGKTSGKGHKGQKARAGGTPRPAYRDVIKKIPKLRGHGVNRARTINPNRPLVQTLTLSLLDKNYDNGDTVSRDTLSEKGLLDRKAAHVKVLGTGNLTKKLTFEGILFTTGAKEKIESAGGKI